MDTPKYSSTIVVGGSGQKTQFTDAFPSPTGSSQDVIITKQSGELTLTFVDDAGADFDITGLAGTEAFVVPFNSDVTPVSLGTGIVSSGNVYTITWTKDTIPDDWSSFPQDREGSIVLYVQLDETGDDFFQTFTRFNVDDGDFKGDATTVPLIIFDYTWNDANSADWTKYGQGTPTTLDEATTTLAQAGKTDWGIVINQTEVTAPGSPTNGDTYVIAGIGGDWSGFVIGDIARWNDTTWTNKTPVDGDEIFDAALSVRYRNDGAAWLASAGSGDMTIAVYDPTAVSGDAFLRSNMNGTQIASTISNFDAEVAANSAVTANTAKVTNATHTGDVTGATSLILASVAITGQTTVTADSADFLLISDTSDSGNLKKVLVSDIGGGAGSDTTAIHDNVAGEILAITEKVTPVTGDYLIIEDGADSNNKKRVNVANLPTGAGGQSNTASNVGGFVGIFKQKTGVDLEYKTVQSSDGSLTPTGNTSDVDIVLDVTNVNAWTGQQYFAQQTLSDGANISWDLDTEQTAVVTLAGNRTLDNPTNMVAGGTYIVRVVQDVTGTRTLAFGANYLWSGGTAPTLTTTAAAVDILTFVSDGTNMYGTFIGDFS